MCVTTYCLYPWLPDSMILNIALSMIGGLTTWKLIKAMIDTIPLAG